MFTVPSFMRSRRTPRAPVAVEGLEGRVMFTFNAYIAGLASGAVDSDASFVFSTTGQAAKSWDINWGDLSSHTILTAADPAIGYTTPQTVTHHYGSQPGNFAV